MSEKIQEKTEGSKERSAGEKNEVKEKPVENKTEEKPNEEIKDKKEDKKGGELEGVKMETKAVEAIETPFVKDKDEKNKVVQSPKKKEGKKKPVKEPRPDPLDMVEVSDMGPNQTEAHVGRVRVAMDKEKEERNIFQLGRDMLMRRLEVALKRIKDLELNNSNLLYNEQKLTEQHHNEMEIMKQKIKYLQFENQRKVENAVLENGQAIKQVMDNNKMEITQAKLEMREAMNKMKTNEVAHNLSIRSLKNKHAEDMAKVQEDFEKKITDLQWKYKNKMLQRETANDLKFRNELHEVEERKNFEIHSLIQTHNKIYKDMKNYYNDITMNSINLINGLKAECETLRKKDDLLSSKMKIVEKTNKDLSNKLDLNLKEGKEIETKLKKLTQENQFFSIKTKQLNKMEEKVQNQDKEILVLTELIKTIKEEREDLRKKFSVAVLDVNQKANLKSCLLDSKVEALNKQNEVRKIQINKLLRVCNVDPNQFDQFTTSVEELINSKDNLIKDLQYELARVCKAHSDLLKTFSSRLQSYYIPPMDMAFFPIKTGHFDEKLLGKGPAGLISRCP